MVSELEVIFCLNTVAGKLHVARQRLILFKQLSRIAALTIVLTIAVRPSGVTLGTLSTATATAAALTIVDQESCSLSHRAPQHLRRPLISSLGGSDGPVAGAGPREPLRKSTLLAVLARKA